MSDPEIICERRGAAGFILLNRPDALNALTPPMVRALGASLLQWDQDPAIARVVIRGAGNRAFCVGGDIRLIRDQGLAGDHASQLSFWRAEYQLNRMIARYKKPYVALMDGFVMGGGAGVSIHGSHRIAGDRLAFAMPEVSIGFFPDVGSTFFLSRLPHRIGVWLALAGARIGAGDACASGLATTFVPSAEYDALAEALTLQGDTNALIARFSAPAPAPATAAHFKLIETCFDAPDIATILSRLDAAAARSSDSFATVTAAGLRQNSPTSLAIALRQMQLGAGLTIEDALRAEFRIVSRICRRHDLYEGVRAAIIDKGSAPQWRPARLEDIVPSDIDTCFAPLGADELEFPMEALA